MALDCRYANRRPARVECLVGFGGDRRHPHRACRWRLAQGGPDLRLSPRAAIECLGKGAAPGRSSVQRATCDRNRGPRSKRRSHCRARPALARHQRTLRRRDPRPRIACVPVAPPQRIYAHGCSVAAYRSDPGETPPNMGDEVGSEVLRDEVGGLRFVDVRVR